MMLNLNTMLIVAEASVGNKERILGQHYERYRLHSILGTEAPRTDVVGAHSLQEMVAKLKKPRRVMILVKAGAAVDAFIEKLIPLLSQGDIIIDGSTRTLSGGPRTRRAGVSSS